MLSLRPWKDSVAPNNGTSQSLEAKSPNTACVSLSPLSIGAPVKPMNDVLGNVQPANNPLPCRASRIVASCPASDTHARRSRDIHTGWRQTGTVLQGLGSWPDSSGLPVGDKITAIFAARVLRGPRNRTFLRSGRGRLIGIGLSCYSCNHENN